MAFPDPSSIAGQTDWRLILGSVLPWVDIFIPSVEEILFLLQNATYRELQQSVHGGDILPLITPQLLSDLGRELIGMGAKTVGLKLGYRGLYLRTGSLEQLHQMGAPSRRSLKHGRIRSCGRPVSRSKWRVPPVRVMQPSPVSWPPCCEVYRLKKQSTWLSLLVPVMSKLQMLLAGSFPGKKPSIELPMDGNASLWN